MSVPEGLLPVDADALFAPHDTYQVVAVTQTQMTLSTDELIDAVEINFVVIGRPGVFSYTTPLEFFEVFAPFIGLAATAALIERIYAL